MLNHHFIFFKVFSSTRVWNIMNIAQNDICSEDQTPDGFNTGDVTVTHIIPRNNFFWPKKATATWGPRPSWTSHVPLGWRHQGSWSQPRSWSARPAERGWDHEENRKANRDNTSKTETKESIIIFKKSKHLAQRTRNSHSSHIHILYPSNKKTHTNLQNLGIGWYWLLIGCGKLEKMKPKWSQTSILFHFVSCFSPFPWPWKLRWRTPSARRRGARGGCRRSPAARSRPDYSGPGPWPSRLSGFEKWKKQMKTIENIWFHRVS